MPGGSSLQLVFVLIGTVFVLVGVGIALWRIAFLRSRKRTTAEVVSVIRGARHKSGSGTTSRSQTVVVRFTPEDGPSVEARDTNAMSDYATGQSVTVYYDAAEPTDVVIAGLFRFWFLPVLFTGLGTAFVVVAAGL